MSAWRRSFSSRGRGAVIICVSIVASVVAIAGLLIIVDEFDKKERPVLLEFRDFRALEKQERQAWDRNFEEAEARQEQWEREYEARRLKQEQEVRRIAEEMKKRPAPKRREVRRWRWKSPAEIRAEIWQVPANEAREATETALLRICTSEMEGSENDCVGIWQVARNIRSRSCDRSYTDLITECDENGETHLSAMRRLSRYVVGAVPPKHRRHRWIANLELDCEMPRLFPRDQQFWDRHHRRNCERMAKLVRGLVGGTRRQTITRAPIIAWGGRCEDPGGACDDPLACARGLARVPGLETGNAFWCKQGARRCRQDPEPVCVQLGYGPRPVVVSTDGERNNPGREEVSGAAPDGAGQDLARPRHELRGQEEHLEEGQDA